MATSTPNYHLSQLEEKDKVHIEGFNNDMTSIDTQLKVLADKITALETATKDLSTLKSTLSTLQSSMSSVNSDISSMKSSISSLQSSLGSAGMRVSSGSFSCTRTSSDPIKYQFSGFSSSAKIIFCATMLANGGPWFIVTRTQGLMLYSDNYGNDANHAFKVTWSGNSFTVQNERSDGYQTASNLGDFSKASDNTCVYIY